MQVRFWGTRGSLPVAATATTVRDKVAAALVAANGRSFADFAELNAQARHWLSHVANVREHATTGRRPVDLWREEGLTSVSSLAPYRLYEITSRKAGFDGFVRFERSRYSIPPEYAGQTVLVGKQGQRIVIRSGDMIVAEHALEAAGLQGR